MKLDAGLALVRPVRERFRGRTAAGAVVRMGLGRDPIRAANFAAPSVAV